MKVPSSCRRCAQKPRKNSNSSEVERLVRQRFRYRILKAFTRLQRSFRIFLKFEKGKMSPIFRSLPVYRKARTVRNRKQTLIELPICTPQCLRGKIERQKRREQTSKCRRFFPFFPKRKALKREGRWKEGHKKAAESLNNIHPLTTPLS